MEIDLFGNLIVEPVEEQDFSSKKSPFDYTNDIANKTYPDSFTDYNPWLANSSFSQRKDTIFYANEINKYHLLGHREQFDFYYHSLPKKKYFAKWAKSVKSEHLDSIMSYYNVGPKVALQYERVLKKEQLDEIYTWFNTKEGGRRK